MKAHCSHIKACLVCAAWLSLAAAYGQKSQPNKQLENGIEEFFTDYNAAQHEHAGTARMLSYDVSHTTKTIVVKANSAFAARDFTSSDVRKIYKRLRKRLPKPYNKYNIQIVANGLTIDELVPDARYSDYESPNMWGDIDYDGSPWVSNASRPHPITHGLSNRHIALWASHGRYYDADKGVWKWQRPNLFGTTEDLFTQSIVIPYLIPMLENAGANVFTPRERDYQTHEIIVDNDNGQSPYFTIDNNDGRWQKTSNSGFAYHKGTYNNGENPFTAGTAIMSKTTSKTSKTSEVVYQPNLPVSGRYAVYASYQTLPESVTDAEYIIYHKGQATTMRVNQQMGGSTWVYLGTYEFAAGCSPANSVAVSNRSSEKGWVTTDAIRFGGGMGNIQRGGSVSGLPRCLEGARYSAQWSGAQPSAYDGKGGADDYSDDINVRSRFTNWLGGGSVYIPSVEGKGVPLELCLAIHSDAGCDRSGGIIGSLSICTTNFNDGRLNSGISRLLSKDFADSLLTGITRDLRLKYGAWTRRSLYDRNYSETRLPEVPSAIIETLSHQNFTDMRFGHDPNFKFTLARSIYKTILRFINSQHGRPCVVQPLTPSNFRAELQGGNKVRLSWLPTDDEAEPTATATSYNIYTAAGEGGFDNGQTVGTTACMLDIEPETLYSFRVTAVNRGGESFPTQTLSVYQPAADSKRILVVDNFDRLSSPEVIDTDSTQGFDLDTDIGVQRGLTTCWNGAQTVFDKSRMGGEGPTALGFGGDELAGIFFMGNDFRQAQTHAVAIADGKKYSVSSCSHEAVENGFVSLSDYDCVDIASGLQKNDGHSLQRYKAFTPTMRTRLTDYLNQNGRLLISGAYVGSDAQTEEEQRFLSEKLKSGFACSLRDSAETIKGLGTEFDFHRYYNPDHYAAPTVDVLVPVAPAYCAMLYGNGNSAAVAYDGTDFKTLTMGFPFECIKERRDRQAIMGGVLGFLLKQ